MSTGPVEMHRGSCSCIMNGQGPRTITDCDLRFSDARSTFNLGIVTVPYFIDVHGYTRTLVVFVPKY
ncbi:hypothetical protein H2248_002491 [Termitomyces sp. 'cryptogamus']|nr:hypothetical protein H2248_002491 [Termitomyces sp. 'cryptogamus']